MREECHRGEALFSLFHLGGTRCQHDSLLVTLDHLIKVVSAGFLNCKLAAFPFAMRGVVEILGDFVNVLFLFKLLPHLHPSVKLACSNYYYGFLMRSLYFPHSCYIYIVKWKVIALQRCVSFCCKQSESALCPHVSPPP